MAERLRGRRGGGRETRTDTQTRRSAAPAAWSEAGAAWSVAKLGGERMPRSGCHEPTREAERRASGRGAEGERARCGGEEAGTGSGAQRSDGRPTIAFLHCCAMVAEHFKAPSGSGRGQAEQAGGRGGVWDRGGATAYGIGAPSGSGRGQAEQAGGRGGVWDRGGATGYGIGAPSGSGRGQAE